MTVSDGRARKQNVRLGLRAGARVEIVDGAVAGDLAVPVTAGLLTGQRVRPVLP